jgi:hypothetical protein
MRWIIISSLMALLLLFDISAATAKIYTWTDADGVKRYSNAAPPEGAVNVKTIDEIPADEATDDPQREEYDRMVEDASQNADEHFKQQSEDKAKEEEADQERQLEKLNQRVSQERARLQKQIDAIRSRGLGPNFTNGMKANQVKQVEEKIHRLESDPESYFNNNAGS